MIYLDNSATAPLKKEVLDSMMPYLTGGYGNASSIYEIGRKSRAAIEEARKTIAERIGALPGEIYFTAGGSESDNWAIKGVMARSAKTHIISSAIEHHAVLHTLQFMEKKGYKVTYLPVDSDGKISLSDLENAITEETGLITIMTANNEIGTIEPIEKIGEIAKKHNVLFHTDAVQAIGLMDINVKEMNIDMLSMSAHKFGGPKGIGVLYVRRGINIENLIHGGAQERTKRAGTENVASIVGMAKAIELATEDINGKTAKMAELRDKTIASILEKIPYVRLNGHKTDRLAGNINMSFQYIEGEALLLSLDMAGIAASSGSACTSGSLDPSHVLLAIGLPHEIAHGSLRLSMSENTTEEEMEKTVSALCGIVDRLRQMSPLWEEVNK
ncbi:MAG: cysteine desulfurase NifS [Clostridia bacterium]|nr:cysteine desulfurase NifS [Clostridia bacterium]